MAKSRTKPLLVSSFYFWHIRTNICPTFVTWLAHDWTSYRCCRCGSIGTAGFVKKKTAAPLVFIFGVTPSNFKKVEYIFFRPHIVTFTRRKLSLTFGNGLLPRKLGALLFLPHKRLTKLGLWQFQESKNLSQKCCAKIKFFCSLGILWQVSLTTVE